MQVDNVDLLIGDLLALLEADTFDLQGVHHRLQDPLGHGPVEQGLGEPHMLHLDLIQPVHDALALQTGRALASCRSSKYSPR